jgi:UDP-N-acetylmuramyl-tripeptide synthetase
MLLKEIASILGEEAEILGDENTEIKDLATHHLQVKEGSLFVALKGERHNGTEFLEEARSRGARAILIEPGLPWNLLPPQISCLIVPSTKAALWRLGEKFYSWNKRAKIIGVTGTNGKTTTTFFLQALLGKEKTARFGSLGYSIPNYKEEYPVSYTTPPPLTLIRLLAEAERAGMDYIVMEVTSHALAQSRCEGIELTAAIFTNLTEEHLDYHSDMENYYQTKKSLFSLLKKEGVGVINIDDSWGKRLSFELLNKPTPSLRLVRYGEMKEAAKFTDLPFSEISSYPPQIRGEKKTKFILPQLGELSISLPGKHNIYNAVAALGVILAFKREGFLIKKEEIEERLNSIECIPGRLEFLNLSQNYDIVVDYAHTPQALKELLLTLLPIVKNRLILVFGCGGNRDKSKRPQMGKIAQMYSSFQVVTTDNPRDEPPNKIIEDIEQGMEDKSRYKSIISRKEAIFWALKEAKSGDLVVIAGRGDERYQIWENNRRIPFWDKEVIKEYFQAK